MARLSVSHDPLKIILIWCSRYGFFFVSLMWIDDIIINVYYHQCAKKLLFYELKNSKEQQVEIVCKIILSTLTIHETFHTKKFEFQMGFK